MRGQRAGAPASGHDGGSAVLQPRVGAERWSAWRRWSSSLPGGCRHFADLDSQHLASGHTRAGDRHPCSQVWRCTARWMRKVPLSKSTSDHWIPRASPCRRPRESATDHRAAFLRVRATLRIATHSSLVSGWTRDAAAVPLRSARIGAHGGRRGRGWPSCRRPALADSAVPGFPVATS